MAQAELIWDLLKLPRSPSDWPTGCPVRGILLSHGRQLSLAARHLGRDEGRFCRDIHLTHLIV